MSEVDERADAYGDGPLADFADFVTAVALQAPNDAGVAYVGTWFLESVDAEKAEAALDVIASDDPDLAARVRSGYVPPPPPATGRIRPS